MASAVHWTPRQVEEFKAAHPDNTHVTEWPVMDGRHVYEFCDSEAKAKEVAAGLNTDDRIGERFQDWLDATAAEFRVTLDHLREVIQAEL